MLDINPVISQKKEEKASPYPNPTVINPQKPAEEPESLEFLAGKEDNSKMLFVFTAIVGVIVLAIIGYVYFVSAAKNQELSTKQKTYDELAAKLKTPELASIEDTATRYSGGLKSLNTLFKTNLAYSKVFSAFEKITPNEVVWQNFIIDSQNQIKITATANSLDDSAKFIKALKDAQFISGLNLDNDTLMSTEGKTNYTVSVSATFLPDVLIAEEVTNAGT